MFLAVEGWGSSISLSCSKFLLLWFCINIPILSLAMDASIQALCGLLGERRRYVEDKFYKKSCFTGHFSAGQRCYPFLACAGRNVLAVIWICWSETLKRLIPSLILWEATQVLLSAGRSVRQGTEGGWDFPFQRQQAVRVVWLHHQSTTPETRSWFCPLPAAALLAQAFAALSVLVPGLHIWQLMLWLCLNVCQPKLIISWASNASLLLKGEGPASLYSCLWCTPFPLAIVSLVEPSVSLSTVC